MKRQALILVGLMVFLGLISCGVVKGHKNPVIDKGIKVVNEAIPQDSPAEEFIEDVIEDATGIEMDLSPNTSDPDDEVVTQEALA